MVYNSLGQWVNNTNAGVSSINGLTGQVEIKTINNNPLTGVGNLSILGVSSEFAEFLTSGTWTKPAGVTWVYVEAVGGGGSGGLSIAVNDAATPMSGVSTGGGGGRFASKLFKANSLPGTVTVTVGAGGASKSLTKSTNSSSFLMSGSSGGASSFGDLVVAAGGGNGNAATYATSGSGPTLVAGGAAGGGCKNGIGGGFDSASAVGYGTQAPLGSIVQNGTNRGGGAGGTTIANGGIGISGGQSLFDGSGSNSVSVGSGTGQSSSGGLGGGGSGGVNASVATAAAVTITSGAGGGGYVRIYCW
jgi:hypothetical protein